MNAIDAVISWVDGYDRDYQKKLSDFCLQQGVEQNEVIEPTRIQQLNEIYYCLHSLKQFAPWIRTIYIITNQQTPPALNLFKATPFGQKIQVIDQNNLLKAHHVAKPIFNSISVEWLIWLIPGLSNNFLYLNDDFFILRPVKPEDFFYKNKLVLRGEWKVQIEKKMGFVLKKKLFNCFGKETTAKNNPHRAWQEKSAQLSGWKKHFYLLPHAPFPLNKKTFNNFIQKKHELFYENLHYPFRHVNQTSSVPLMVHHDIKEKNVVFDNYLRAIMVNGACHNLDKIKLRLQQAQHDKRIAFLCMQSIDQASPETQDYMLHWLEKNIINLNLSTTLCENLI